MKQRLILIIAACAIFLVGCSLKSDTNMVEEGKKLLEKHDYKQAMKILSSALEEDGSDEYARAMYIQAMRMLKVSRYEEDGNYEKALEELEIIEKIKNGSTEIRNEASNKKAELKKINDEAEKAKIERKEKAKYSASQDKGRIESDAFDAMLKDKKSKESNSTENKQESTEEDTNIENNNSNNNQDNNQNNNQQPDTNNQPNVTPPQPEVSQ